MEQRSKDITWCDCGAEVVLLESTDWGVEMAMMYYGTHEERGTWEKLRWIWAILWGKLWLDQVILTPEAARHLSKRLAVHAEQAARAAQQSQVTAERK